MIHVTRETHFHGAYEDDERECFFVDCDDCPKWGLCVTWFPPSNATNAHGEAIRLADVHLKVKHPK